LIDTPALFSEFTALRRESCTGLQGMPALTHAVCHAVRSPVGPMNNHGMTRPCLKFELASGFEVTPAIVRARSRVASSLEALRPFDLAGHRDS